MTIREALNWSLKKLSNSDSPSLDAELLLSFVLKKDKAFLFTYPEKILNSRQINLFKKLINLRAQNWPVAYLTHSRNFLRLNFFVNENVLIPRPWTEALVVKASEVLKNKSGLKILDVGTGSGAIIIGLAKLLGPKNKYFATDISAKALAVAKKNANSNKVKITFKKSDLLKSITQEFDVVTANLPYLEKKISVSTKHEPKLALISKNKGLKHYQDLVFQLDKWKRHPKFIFIECEPKQVKQLQNLFDKTLPETQVHIISDSSAVIK